MNYRETVWCRIRTSINLRRLDYETSEARDRAIFDIGFEAGSSAALGDPDGPDELVTRHENIPNNTRFSGH